MQPNFRRWKRPKKKKERKKKTNSLLEPPEGMQPYLYIDVSPTRPILEF